MKIHNLAAFCVAAASAVLLGAVDSARADEWFVMGSQTLKSADPSAEITDARESMAERRQAGKALCRGR